MPRANYVSPEVRTTLTTDEIRRRYRDTALLVFKDHHLSRLRSTKESERDTKTYLSFGINRRTMLYSNNGNEPVTVHRKVNDAAVQANENSRFTSQIFKMYSKPRESCTIS